MAIRCFWPPDNMLPLLPTMVENPSLFAPVWLASEENGRRCKRQREEKGGKGESGCSGQREKKDVR